MHGLTDTELTVLTPGGGAPGITVLVTVTDHPVSGPPIISDPQTFGYL